MSVHRWATRSIIDGPGGMVPTAVAEIETAQRPETWVFSSAALIAIVLVISPAGPASFALRSHVFGGGLSAPPNDR